MRRQSGMTLIEILVLLTLAGIVALGATVFTLPMLDREDARSAVYNMQSFIHLTKLEAVKRNRPCFLQLATRQRLVQVLDGMDTATRFDDQVLHHFKLPDSVSFSSPDGSVPIILPRFGPPSARRYEMVFQPQGTISSGAGWVTLNGSDYFARLSLWKAGGTQVTRWNGSGWRAGS